MDQPFMTMQERRDLVKSFLGKTVTVCIDRPVGYVHHKGEKTLVYPINYGYIPGVLGGDGEELDVYVLGETLPLESFTGRIVGIVYRADDVEDKLIAAPENAHYTAQEMTAAIHFQEKYFKTEIVTL